MFWNRRAYIDHRPYRIFARIFLTDPLGGHCCRFFLGTQASRNVGSHQTWSISVDMYTKKKKLYRGVWFFILFSREVCFIDSGRKCARRWRKRPDVAEKKKHMKRYRVAGCVERQYCLRVTIPFLWVARADTARDVSTTRTPRSGRRPVLSVSMTTGVRMIHPSRGW